MVHPLNETPSKGMKPLAKKPPEATTESQRTADELIARAKALKAAENGAKPEKAGPLGQRAKDVRAQAEGVLQKAAGAPKQPASQPPRALTPPANPVRPPLQRRLTDSEALRRSEKTPGKDLSSLRTKIGTALDWSKRMVPKAAKTPKRAQTGLKIIDAIKQGLQRKEAELKDAPAELMEIYKKSIKFDDELRDALDSDVLLENLEVRVRIFFA